MKAQKILFVCLGNICRSPSAEIILRQKLTALGLADKAQVDSCGTAAYHSGSKPDARMLQALEKAGYVYDGHRARMFTARDFADFDLIIPQDDYNLADILFLASSEEDHAKVIPMSYWFTPEYAARFSVVPDPYYGGRKGFDEVVDLLATACDRLIADRLL